MNRIKQWLASTFVKLSEEREAEWNERIAEVERKLAAMRAQTDANMEAVARAKAAVLETGARYNRLRSRYEARLYELALLQETLRWQELSEQVMKRSREVNGSVIRERVNQLRQEDISPGE